MFIILFLLVHIEELHLGIGYMANFSRLWWVGSEDMERDFFSYGAFYLLVYQGHGKNLKQILIEEITAQYTYKHTEKTAGRCDFQR